MTGKEKCDYLKKLRASISEAYKIDGFEYKKCEFSDNCIGTCPACDKEAQLLYEKLKSLGFEIDAETLKEVEQELFPKPTLSPLESNVHTIDETLGIMWIDPDAEKEIEKNKKEDVIKGTLNAKGFEKYYKNKNFDNPDKKPRGLRGIFKKK